MANLRIPTLVVFGLGLLLAFVAIFAPWWTSKVEVSGNDHSESAKPFDNGNLGNGESMIKDGEAVTAGVLSVLGVLALLAAVALSVASLVTNKSFSLVTPWVAFGAAILIGLAAILALTTWPGDDAGDPEFWDSSSVSQSGYSITTKAYASVGWYLAVVAAVAGIAGGVLAFIRPANTPGQAASA